MTDDRSEIIVEDAALAGGFVQVPAVAMFDPALSPGAKVSYGVLLWYAWKRGEFPGQAVMAADLGAGERTVRRHLAELEEAGYIAVEQLGLGRPNRYVIKTLQGRQIPDRPKMAGLGGQNRPVKAAKNGRSLHLNSDLDLQDSNEDESFSFFGQVGERWGRTERDARALAKSMAKYPRQAVEWAEELLTPRLSEIDNPAAWLNAVVPRLVGELAERRRGELTQRQEDLVVIRATADFYGRNEDPARVRAHLLEDFPGEADLVDQALDQVFGKAQVGASA